MIDLSNLTDTEDEKDEGNFSDSDTDTDTDPLPENYLEKEEEKEDKEDKEDKVVPKVTETASAEVGSMTVKLFQRECKYCSKMIVGITASNLEAMYRSHNRWCENHRKMLQARNWRWHKLSFIFRIVSKQLTGIVEETRNAKKLQIHTLNIKSGIY